MFQIWFSVNIHYPQRQRLNPHCSVSLNQTPLQLDMEGIKEREGGQRGEGKAIIPGSRTGGGGGLLIERRLLFEEIQ